MKTLNNPFFLVINREASCKYFLYLLIFTFFLNLLFYTAPANASLWDDVKNGDFVSIAGKRKIKSWNKENENNYKIEDVRIGCGGNISRPIHTLSKYEILFGKEDEKLYNCTISGLLKNNTNVIINSIVIKVSAYNKQSKTFVVSDSVIAFNYVVPSASKDFKLFFNSHKLISAQFQLKDNISWVYEIIGVVPEEMKASWILDE